jgi:hypothetical protein
MRVQYAVVPRAGNSCSINILQANSARRKDVSNDDWLLAQNAVYPETFGDYVLILTQTEILCAASLSVSIELYSL